ncbi:MAG: hypothetical protein RIC19_21170 [Phaeodactylibacter sp.]|uniref:hypothetical protein n=1 Tax=Phaeodactylibacter sp. TaxID=1940289 RepID=UPI0032EEB1BF
MPFPKTFRSVWLSASLLLSLGVQSLNACGAFDDSIHYFNLFVPEWLFGEEYQPTFYTSSAYYNIWAKADYPDANLQSWQHFFEKPVKEDPLRKVLYDSWIEGYHNVGRDVLVKSVLFDGSMVSIPRQEAAKQYLLLALEMEALSNRPTDTWGYGRQEELTPEAAANLTERLKKAMEREKFPFLKNRYAFQLLKAYRYTGQTQEAIQFYNKYFAPLEQKDLISYWAMDHYAGLLLQAGETGKGYYHFLKVFEQAPSRRHSAYHSFNIANSQDWTSTYKQCQTNQDKALMHFIRGTKQDVLGLEDMRSIFGLLGNHEWLRIVMSREINKLESNNLKFYGQQPIAELMKRVENGQSLLKNEDYEDYAGQLLRFSTTAYYNNRDDHFWALAKGYLELMLGRLSTARITLEQAGELEGPQARIQGELLLAIQLMQQVEPLSTVQENTIAIQLVELFADPMANWSTQQNNQEFILELLAHRKRLAGDHIMARLLAREVISSNKTNPDMEGIDSLLTFINQPDPSELELLALKHFTGNEATWSSFVQDPDAAIRRVRYDVLDIKGRLLMRDPQTLGAAAALFDSLPAEYDFPLEENPFNMSINDCVHCKAYTSASFTRNRFVRKLAEVYQIAQETNSPTDYYLLGNAYYNMTYFGPAYEIMNFFRSGVSYDGFYDCRVALGFYDKAMKYAQEPEMAAQACFMAAKAQQKVFYVKAMADLDQANYWSNKFIMDDWSNSETTFSQVQSQMQAQGYLSYFKRLKEQYPQTRFFQRAIRECNYLNYYVSQ